jgi:hypothetical protein
VARRFYFHETDYDGNDITPSISPAYGAGWDKTSAAERRRCTLNKNETAITGVSVPENSATSPYDVLIRQYVSEALQAQTISGTVKGQLCAHEQGNYDHCRAILIRVFSGDGATERGTLYSEFPESIAGEFYQSALGGRNIYFPASTSVSDVEAQAGDRIVIEIGYRSFNTSTSNWYSGFWLGDNGATDLPENETDTNESKVPWIEFSQDITFLSSIRVHQVFVQIEYEPGVSTTTSASTSRSSSKSSTKTSSASTTRTTSRSTSRTWSSASTSKTSSKSSSASTSASVTSGSTSKSWSSASTSQSTTKSWSSASSSQSTSRSTSCSSSLTTSTITPPPLLPPFTFESRLAEEPPSIRMARLNGAGEDKDNPIVLGIHFRITYHKHGPSETFKKCWITSNDEVFSDLTSRCIESSTTIYVDVESGVDLESDAPAILNKMHFTTNFGHIKYGIWVTKVDAVAVVTLDGYNATISANPYIYRAE